MRGSHYFMIQNTNSYNMKTAIIMGGTSGIGREVAVQLAQTGEWQVAVCGRN